MYRQKTNRKVMLLFQRWLVPLSSNEIQLLGTFSERFHGVLSVFFSQPQNLNWKSEKETLQWKSESKALPIENLAFSDHEKNRFIEIFWVFPAVRTYKFKNAGV